MEVSVSPSGVPNKNVWPQSQAHDCRYQPNISRAQRVKHMLMPSIKIDPSADMSGLVVCWSGDDVGISLPDLIDREISSVEWEKYAVDGSI